MHFNKIKWLTPKAGLLVGCVFINILVYSQDIESQFQKRGECYFKFRITSNTDIKKISSIISIDRVINDSVVANASLAEFKKFQALGIDYQFIPHTADFIKDKALDFQEIRKIDDWNFYPTYDAYLEIMDDFAADYPEICKIETIGTLSGGRKLLVAKISKNVEETSNKPRFLCTATIHGDELTGFVLSLRLIDYLISNYGSNDFVSRLVDSVEIWINPLSNPDGTYSAGNHTIAGAKRRNASNVDLNRNYPDPVAGPNPDGNLWQQETVFFMDFAGSKKFNISSNWHGGAECCNYPWDTWQHLAADNAWWVYTMREYADTVHAYSPSPYLRGFNEGITNGYAWYTITGGRQDYMNYFHQCREFTLEISNTKTPSADQLPIFWDYNYRSFLNYIEQSLFGIRGTVLDTLTGEPIRAKVYISGHDQDSSFVYSSLPAGNYHRYLYQGNYNLTFSATGYYSKTITNVSVVNRQTTWLNIKLSRIEGGIGDIAASFYIKAFPNPVTGGMLKIESDIKIVSIGLITTTGSTIITVAVNATMASLDLAEIPKGVYILKVCTENNIALKKIIIL